MTWPERYATAHVGKRRAREAGVLPSVLPDDHNHHGDPAGPNVLLEFDILVNGEWAFELLASHETKQRAVAFGGPAYLHHRMDLVARQFTLEPSRHEPVTY